MDKILSKKEILLVYLATLSQLHKLYRKVQSYY
jgi:hypothetical protein